MADTTIKLSGTYDSIEAYELLEEMRGVASDYLPLTGGEISGDLIVDGQLSANLIGNVTGTASGNLPLSGGTMAGPIILNTMGLASRSVNDSFLQINGGTEQTNGAWLRLNGKDNTGVFQVRANDGTNDTALVGNPNGTLTWNSKELERVHAYSISASTGYVRYTSGLQIVWGDVSSVGTTAVEKTYAVAFSAYPSVVATANSNATIYINANNSTRFTVRTASGTTTVRYIAIGKWQ